jgi:hypothetical protein
MRAPSKPCEGENTSLYERELIHLLHALLDEGVDFLTELFLVRVDQVRRERQPVLELVVLHRVRVVAAQS